MHIKHYLTTTEAAEYLTDQLKQQVKYYDLDNLLRADAIPHPVKIGGRRVWSREDLKRAAKALKVRRAKRPVLTDKRSLMKQGGQDE
jgi:hypothetical protein